MNGRMILITYLNLFVSSKNNSDEEVQSSIDKQSRKGVYVKSAEVPDDGVICHGCRERCKHLVTVY